MDPGGDQDGLTLAPLHQLRSGGGAVFAGTAGDGDREESVGRFDLHLGSGRLKHIGAKPLIPAGDFCDSLGIPESLEV